MEGLPGFKIKISMVTARAKTWSWEQIPKSQIFGVDVLAGRLHFSLVNSYAWVVLTALPALSGLAYWRGATLLRYFNPRKPIQ